MQQGRAKKPRKISGKFFQLFFKNLLTNAKRCGILSPVAKRAAPQGGERKVSEKFFKKLFKNLLTNTTRCDIISKSSGKRHTREHSSAGRASALQAEGHRFEPCCSHHSYGPVVQLVRTLACHARGQGFESPSGRHFLKKKKTFFASVAQLVEHVTENHSVVGSIPTGGTILKGSGNHSATSMRI